MPTLRSLGERWAELEARMLDIGEVDADGVPSPELAAELTAFDLDEVPKVDGYQAIILKLDVDIEMHRKEEVRIAQKRRAIETRKLWLLQRVREYMDQRELTKLEGKFSRGFRLQQNGKAPVLLLASVEHLPAEFVRVTKEPDKVAIHRYLESQGEGAHLLANDNVTPVAALGEKGVSLRWD